PSPPTAPSVRPPTGRAAAAPGGPRGRRPTRRPRRRVRRGRRPAPRPRTNGVRAGPPPAGGGPPTGSAPGQHPARPSRSHLLDVDEQGLELGRAGTRVA